MLKPVMSSLLCYYWPGMGTFDTAYVVNHNISEPRKDYYRHVTKNGVESNFFYLFGVLLVLQTTVSLPSVSSAKQPSD